jgi:hypothetical protein
MDINSLLNFVEEILNMYDYETKRNVGIVGGEIVTTPLEHELGTEAQKIKKRKEKGIVYKVDILADKIEGERPFGRIVVRYKRGDEPVEVGDVKQFKNIVDTAGAYSGLLLTVNGYTPEAQSTASTFGNVTIMTPEKVQTLLGKAMTKEKWWYNAPAYPVTWDYEKVKWKLQWFFEKILFINFDCIWFFNKELAYEPYWKFSYHVAPKKPGEPMHQGFFAINAFTGEIDTWIDIEPELADTQTLKEAWFVQEAIHTVEFVHMVPRTKIQKPKLPKGVNYVVYRPAMEKHEAKLAAIQWIAYVEGVDPEDVVITGRELLYYPWWKFFYFYRPVVKNAWQDTEWTGFKMSAVYGDIFNQWQSYHFRRDIIYYYMERSLIKILGRDRYVRFMRKVTMGIAFLWWNYHLVIKPSYIWAFLLLITAGTIYAFITATWGLSILFGILLVLIFMGPGYAFLYVLQDYLRRYPVKSYPHPTLTKKAWEKERKPVKEAETALATLEDLEEAGKLTATEKKELEHIRKRKVKALVKKAKGKKKWFGK